MRLARQVAYQVAPRLRREVCKRCWRENPVGFSVPDDVWRAAVPGRHCQHVLCLSCFDAYATKRGVDWLQGGCEFFPVPGITYSDCRAPSPCIGHTLRPLLAWYSARRSRSSASPSSSDTNAKCRTESLSAYAKGRSLAFLLLSRLTTMRREAMTEKDRSQASGVYRST
jgi:hypothetical protein